MNPTFNADHLKMLMYYFGAREVATFLGANNDRELLAWIDRSKTPTTEQVARLTHAYTQFTRVHHGEGPVAALAWFATYDIDSHIRDDRFQTVKDLATEYMMPHD